jgi:hypothetical protein
MTTYKWVALIPTQLAGVSYKLGDLWNGVGKSPVNNPAWSPIAESDGSIPAPVPPVPETSKPKEPQPAVDWSSDESAAASRKALAEWRARNP